MFKNYLKIALRNIRRHKGYSFLNVVGLAIGMACCILIFLYVRGELSFDRCHENSDQIYRLVLERRAPEGSKLDTSTPPPLGPALLNDFPQIAHAVRFFTKDNPIPLVSFDSNRFYERGFLFVDSNVFDEFTIPFLQGEPKTALQKPNSIVITQETARKYFGEDNPLGKMFVFENHLDFEVTGVVKNPPLNSTLQFDFLASFSTLYGWLGKEFLDNWQNNMCQTYLLLSKDSAPEELEQQLPAFIKKYLGETNSLQRILLQPLNRIHLYSAQDFRLSSDGDIRNVYILSSVAFIVLLIACINFINLTTARSVRRAKEVCIRKVAGTTKSQLVRQFLGESLLLTGVALLSAIVVVEASIHHFDRLIGRSISTDAIQNGWTLIGLLGIWLFVGLLSGGYPAFILSAFQPVHTLKGPPKTSSGGIIFRKALVVIQFAVSIALIIGTTVIYDQLNFIQNQRMGFDKDQIIVAPIRDEGLRQNPDPLKSRLRQQAGILEVGAAALLPGGPVGKTRFRAEGISDEGTMSMLWIDHDFIRTLGMKLIAGRDFSKNFGTDASEAIILNEEAVGQLGWTSAEAVGKSFELVGSKKGTIIGVVRDFNFTSLHHKIEPIVLHIWPWLNYILVRADVAHVSGVLNDMKHIWQEFDPDHPFTFNFLNDNFDRFYQSEKRLGRISGYFSLLVILIACLGLFGLAAFTTQQRTKEIGIRKVLGSSVSGIIVLLTKEFIRWVIVANIIAWPVAYFVMNRWLQNFAYRIEMSLWMFILAGALALLIALVTVSYQAIRAATANPVESLRYE